MVVLLEERVPEAASHGLCAMIEVHPDRKISLPRRTAAETSKTFVLPIKRALDELDWSLGDL